MDIKLRQGDLEPAAEIMSRPLHDWGPDSADRSLHTVERKNPDSDISLDLLVCSGRRRWLRRINREGPGPGATKMYSYGEIALFIGLYFCWDTPNRE
jgi:hypothetical protein